MNWDDVLKFEHDTGLPLYRRIEALFAQQRDTWPALGEGEQALAHLHRKTLRLNGDWIVVQMNPARRASTTAKTDAKSVAARRCFLCPENMPLEERGVAFEDLVIMPNPFPILPMHCTIASREHRPQQLSGQIGKFLRLAAEIGPDLAALYNGPRCGASAPDHFHFQAARAAEIPILAQLPDVADGSVLVHSSFNRNMIFFGRTDPAKVQSDIERSIDALCLIENMADEPMLNLLAHVDRSRYRIVLFPRVAHRPVRYFATGPEHLAVSPAVLEMAGILVTTEPTDFARIDAGTAQAIYAEVSVDRAQLERVLSRVNNDKPT